LAASPSSVVVVRIGYAKTVVRNDPKTKEQLMPAKILSAALVAGLLLAISAPAFAADAPKTKADCEKTKDMKWDDKTSTCVKK
jgi:ABC-type Fe2+-enterobactin transport system substrate-binding protein